MILRHWLRITLVVTLLLVSAALVLGQTTTSTPTFSVVVLQQSPAETKTDLQVVCLFRSSPDNQLHGSLIEVDERLHGLLGQIRRPGLFDGELGETILLTPPPGTLAAKKVLIIGLGDSSSFTPDRMYLIGKIALREADRLGVTHPFFAPTVLDGGVTKYTTGEIAEQVVRGFRDARASESLLHEKGDAPDVGVVEFTYLAGAKHAADTQSGIDHALGK